MAAQLEVPEAAKDITSISTVSSTTTFWPAETFSTAAIWSRRRAACSKSSRSAASSILRRMVVRMSFLPWRMSWMAPFTASL